MNKVKAYATHSATSNLTPFEITRRDLLENDVQIDILYCGICHSDIHVAHNDWGGSHYPFVPGHEIVGRVNAIGTKVTKHKVGDIVGVGCMVDSCQTCNSCKEGYEQYCENGNTGTYNAVDKISGGFTYGGYSKSIVVKENFVVKVPENLDLKATAPLLCAGITTWSPLKHWNVKAGDKVGVIGLGGLGHMAVKFASAMGAHVVMITTSPEKGKDAVALGAHEVLLSNDADAMKQHNHSFNFLLNTIPVGHDANPYLMLLKRDATMVFVGALEPLENFNSRLLIGKRKKVAGSMIGGIKETQEMLNFCGEHNIVSDVEVIDIKDVNKAYERVMKADVKYRFVIDMSTL
jgi:uncharacterized zinc-type alcohol dehydrogenase-like protein